MQPNSCQWQPQQPTVGPQHSPLTPDWDWWLWKQPKGLDSWKLPQSPSLTLTTVAHLMGCSKWGPSDHGWTENDCIDWIRCSSLWYKFSFLWGAYLADPTPLDRLLELEGARDSAIPYLRFMEVNLQILGIKNCNEDVLLLVIPTMTSSEKVPVVIGSKIIDWAMRIITKGELMKVTMTWKQPILGLSCLGCYIYPAWAQMELGWKRMWHLPPWGLTPWRWRYSAWTMSKAQPAPHRRSLFPHLAQ